MDNMQAAILLEKIKFLEVNALKRGFLARNYIDKLQSLEMQGNIKLPKEYIKNTWHLFPVRIITKEVSHLIQFAKMNHIELDVYYPILSHLANIPYTRSYNNKECFKDSENIHNTLIHLPLHNHMSLEEQDKVIEVIYEFFK